jgi:hypothetical protein
MGNITAGARILLDFIYETDAGKPRPTCYAIIFDNRQNRLKKPITQMTLDQVIAAGRNWGSAAWVKKNWGASPASSAAGAGQFMHVTLVGLKQELGLSGSEIFDADLQDRLAMRLLDRRGYETFTAGAIDRVEFGKRLAQEWASLPVLSACRGAHGVLKRGQSYYDGDGVNGARTTPQKVEAILDKVLKTVGPQSAAEPVYLDRTVTVPVVSQEVRALDKPAHKSKTVWMWLTTAVGSVAAIFPGIDWRVQLTIIGVIVCFAVYAIVRRRQIAAVVHEIKQQIEGA